MCVRLMNLESSLNIHYVENKNFTLTQDSHILWKQNNAVFELERLQLEKNLQTQQLRLDTAQDIHDEAGGQLAKIALQLQLMARQTWPLPLQEVQNRLAKIEQDAIQVADSLRQIVFAITPDGDDCDGMLAYFRDYTNQFWQDQPVTLWRDGL